MKTEELNHNGYKYLKFQYFIEDDSLALQQIKDNAKNLSGKVNPHAPDSRIREYNEIFGKNLGGLLAEYSNRKFLQEIIDENKINAKISDPVYNSSKNQTDLIITVNGKAKTVEVRSSFSYKTTFERLFEGAFSIIGWYTTENKPAEIKKDFYIFFVHFYNPELAKEKFENKVETFLLGAVSKETLEQIGQNSELKQGSLTKFRIINPIKKAPSFDLTFNQLFDLKE